MSYREAEVLELKFSSHYGNFGTKEHFFHFFWGYVLPGMSIAIKEKKRNPNFEPNFVLEDCGPIMNSVSRDMFGQISKNITFTKKDKFSDLSVQVPRWDIMMNFDSVLFEDQYSFMGQAQIYRENEFLKNFLHQPNFLENFQRDIQEVREWVLEHLLDLPATDKSSDIKNSETNIIRTRVLEKVRRSVRNIAERYFPYVNRYVPSIKRKILKVFRSSNTYLRNRRSQKCLLICRSPQPEFYKTLKSSEINKSYGVSRRTLINITKTFKFFKAKNQRVEIYKPGSESILQQIVKYHNSDIVIGIKGAELSNILWMKPMSKVFIVKPITMDSPPVYHRFARFLNITCVTVYAKQGPNVDLYPLRHQLDDLILSTP